MSSPPFGKGRLGGIFKALKCFDNSSDEPYLESRLWFILDKSDEGGRRMRIDVHNHLLSADIFERIESRTSFRPGRGSQSKTSINARVGPVVPDISIEERIREMDEHGIDRQFLSFLTDNVFAEETLKESPAKRLELSRVINDYLAEITRQHPDRFMAFADIPLLDIDDAIRELRRAVKELGLHGVTLWTNIHGMPLNSKRFWPLYAELNTLEVPVFLHPTEPREKQGLQEFNLAAMVGFPFETTLAASRLVYSGLFENFKQLRIILNHVGGVIPFLWERLNRGYMNNWQGCRENISKLPTEYLKCFYYDTALSFPEALLFAFKLIGEHLLFGTDYPYTSKKMSNELENVKMIENLNLTREEKERIFSLNALKIVSR